MSAKRRKFDTRTILIILLVIVIIAAAYIVITNLPPEDDTLTPDDVFRNKDRYLGKKIIVRGYFVNTTEGSAIVSTLSETQGRYELKIDYSAVNNASDLLISGQNHVYKFTGVLSMDENDLLGIDVILIVENIKEV